MAHRKGHISRGVRNNNPGNIRHSNAAWHGVADKQTDTGFVQFKEMKWGVRALARTLNTYGRKRCAADGSPIDTLAEVITRWAPPTENDTGAYIRAVAKSTGFKPDAILNLNDKATLRMMTKAIIRHENGSDPVDDHAIAEGVDLAFAGREPLTILPAPAKPKPAKSGTVFPVGGAT